MGWTSITDYCQRNAAAAATAQTAALNFPASSQEFLAALDLPLVHPFCNSSNVEEFFAVPGIPAMGALEHRLGDESTVEQLVTVWLMVAPPLLAMAELWLRLCCGPIAIAGCLYLFNLWLATSNTKTKMRRETKNRPRMQPQRLGALCLMTVASSVVLMTDTFYVLNNGPVVGVLVFVLALGLSIRTILQYSLSGSVAVALWMLVLGAIFLTWDVPNHSLQFGAGSTSIEYPNVSQGLYYDASNEFVQSVVDHWPERSRTYSLANGATPWMPSGDSRTGLPFLLNHWPRPEWHRVFLRVDEEEQEYVALDIAFPQEQQQGFQKSRPVYMILHGLNGGSDEEYIRDFTFRRLEEGATVVVVIARGLMDLPVRGWNIFHGARTSDAHTAALALQRTLQVLQGEQKEGDIPVLIGVGYSMGAIVLSNYVASYGQECALDGAISLSGGLDMRFQEQFERAKRLWQPMLAETLRSDFLLGKWGKRVHERLSKHEMLRMMRATHVTEIDRYAVVPYNGFRDLTDYYSSMSALGDIPINEETGLHEEGNETAKIHSVSIPLCVVHSFDDPLVTWRATADNQGLMHPQNLVHTGSGNIIVLLTKAGGHVGWPLGVAPMLSKWKWMSDAAMSFGEAVAAAKRLQKQNITSWRGSADEAYIAKEKDSV